jgi:hypothetical protein
LIIFCTYSSFIINLLQVAYLKAASQKVTEAQKQTKVRNHCSKHRAQNTKKGLPFYYFVGRLDKLWLAIYVFSIA